MPRTRTPEKEKARADTERWRARKAAAGSAETDLVDAALSAALAVYADAAVRSGKPEAVRRITALETMATNYLVFRGKDPSLALRDIQRRTRRVDVQRLILCVNGTPPAQLSMAR